MTTTRELPPPEDRISVKEAARLLGTHTSAVYRAITASRLGGWRIYGRHVLSRAEVLASVRRSGPAATEGAPAQLPPHGEAVRRLGEAGYLKG